MAKRKPKNPQGIPSELKKLIKDFDSIITRGYDRRRTFDIWIDIMIYMFSFNFNNQEEFEIERKKAHEKIQERLSYFREEERDKIYNKLIQLFHDLGEGMTKKQEDVLGNFYMVEITWNSNGQFFTPPSICKMLSQIVVNKKERNFGLVINDPACGSGTMLLEYAKQRPQNYFIGQDLDLTCVKMCALNLALNSLEGEVRWGNTLLMEKRKVFYVRKNNYGFSSIQCICSE